MVEDDIIFKRCDHLDLYFYDVKCSGTVTILIFPPYLKYPLTDSLSFPVIVSSKKDGEVMSKLREHTRLEGGR